MSKRNLIEIKRSDHKRIPERIVHARGSAAHGFFQVFKSMDAFTNSVKTPVFVRFSTVAGSRCLQEMFVVLL